MPAKSFNEYAEDYDKWFDSPVGGVLFRLEVEAVSLLAKGLEPPFLEIGVGTGRFAEALGIGFGLDPSTDMLKLAKKRGIKVKKGKGEKLPFENESFGAVFLLFTLCFVDDAEKVLSEAKRVLNKEGGLIVGFINRDSLWGLLYMKKKTEGHPIYRHARFYSVREVVALIEDTGLRVEAFSSTLCRPPSDRPQGEAVHDRLVEDAGFVCIRSRKIDRGEKNGG